MTESLVGKIIGNKYVDMDPRWFMIVRECPKTVFVKRLKYKSGPKDTFGKTAYGDEIRFTKKDGYFTSCVEGALVFYNGNYEQWETELDTRR